MRSKLTIDLQALRKNYQALDNLSSPECETAAVVKANAYGLGVKKIAPALYDQGARSFFVATLDEGVELRSLLPDVRIFILNGFWKAAGQEYLKHNLIPVLNAPEEITAYQQLASHEKKFCPAILHVDIGMNRLGVSADDVGRINSDGIDVQYVMGHLSSSEEVDNLTNEKQRKRFEEITFRFPNVKKSLSNSGGVFLGNAFHHDLTRPGIALYGGCAHEEMFKKIVPVVSLSAPILQIREGKSGEFVGYNETYCISKNKKLATLSIGYADGVFRSFGSGGSLFYKGYKLPICGRISMDLITCDLSAVPEGEMPNIGDEVEVIGKHQTIDDLARDAGTISYEILTNLGQRYKRSYIN